MSTLRTRVGLGLCLALLALACTKERGAPRARGPGYSVSAVRYLLAVRAPTRSSNADKQRLKFTTNRGYQVTLERAQLSTYSASLVPCVAEPPTPGAPKGAWRWRDLLVPRALAGHTSVRDPSHVEDATIEDLRIAGERELGARSFPASRYCRVHYLVAGKQHERSGQGAEQATLLLDGSARARDGSETPVHVRTQLAHGRLSELPATLGEAPSEESTLELSFTRELDGLLDDLELGSASAKEIERAALRNLLDQTRIEARWR